MQDEAIYRPTFPGVGTTMLPLCAYNLALLALFAKFTTAIVFISILISNSFSFAFPIRVSRRKEFWIGSELDKSLT